MIKRIVWIVLTLAVLIGFSAAKNFMQFSALEKERSSFTSALDDYLNTSYTRAEADSASIRRKAVIIDTEKKEVDFKTYTKLSDDIRARGPEDVGTVILVTWGTEKEGVYQNMETAKITGDAYRSKAHIQIIDWTNKRILLEKDFFGENIPDGLTREGDFTSQWPMFEVIEYLEKLPREV